MHAGTQSKRISIEHGIARIDHIELATAVRCIACTRHLLLRHHLRVPLPSLLIESVGVRNLRLPLLLLVELWWEMDLHLLRCGI